MAVPAARATGWKLALFASVCAGSLFAAFGGMGVGYTLHNVALLAVAGFFLGAISAPELAPSLFKSPAIWQVAFAVVGCIAIAVLLQAGVAGFTLAVVAGILLGLSAPVWLKHVQLP